MQVRTPLMNLIDWLPVIKHFKVRCPLCGGPMVAVTNGPDVDDAVIVKCFGESVEAGYCGFSIVAHSTLQLISRYKKLAYQSFLRNGGDYGSWERDFDKYIEAEDPELLKASKEFEDNG